MPIPGLDTARLTLRAHTLADFAESAAMWGDPIVTRHIGGRPLTEEECWARLLRYRGHWDLLGFGYWVLRDRAGRFVGEAGFADYHRAIEPALGNTPEIGWALATWAHGQGLATEAVRAIVAWGDSHLACTRTVALIDPGNLASIRVAVKTGYREVRCVSYHGEPTLVYER
jgi:RimJ/RimL family protein N-acetyltransferase